MAGSARDAPAPAHPLAGTTWNVVLARRASESEFALAVQAARFRLLGEIHDNPEHHALQAALLRGLVASGLRPVVALEQFDSEHAAALARLLQRGGATAAEVADAVAFDRAGWEWDYYRPIVEIALANGLPLRAANFSRAAARGVVRDGLAAIDAPRVAVLHLDAAWSPAREAQLRGIIAASHCGALPERALPGMTAAQRVRDATLAAAILPPGPDGAVLIAGNGHVRRDLGVPLYLEAAAPGSAICAVGMLEVTNGRNEPLDYALAQGGAARAFDFVCFTPGPSRDDPCAGYPASAGA